MMGEGEKQEENEPKREKAQISENRKLTEKRKSSSDRLFVLERDLNLDGSLTESRICALELLSAKVKRKISSKKSFILPIKSNCAGFCAHKGKEISTVRLSSHR